MGRPRKKIATEEPADEASDLTPPPWHETPDVLPSVAACRGCRFSVDYLPRVPNGTVILRCQRYPAPVEIVPDYWCGEYRRQ